MHNYMQDVYKGVTSYSLFVYASSFSNRLNMMRTFMTHFCYC